MGRTGFTVIELVLVIAMIAAMAAIAMPKFAGLTNDAHQASTLAVVGVLQEAVGLAHARYLVGQTAGLPPDANDDKYPDHLGDVAAGESTLFDGILEPPLPHYDNGWKQYTLIPFPDGTVYTYLYDRNDNEVLDVGEVLFSYDGLSGLISILWG